ncbi:MAG: protein kinase [Deltaproteobacteria bacterium]|nr:protein kinase [Deltaproteobacteria bacterium]
MKDRLLGRVIADRYRLESRLGVGGMGAVYRARHLLIDRVVAIKILQPERRGEEHFRAWFLREARAANRINHANIVDISDFGETEDGLAYLVMELLVGDALSNLIARGPMQLDEILDIMEQATAALARAHDLGVVHRDIKPDNIHLINRAGRKNFVKVIDFGLARLSQDGRLAAKGAVFGTPEYMSPEQARGEDATPLSDLYSLGIIMFEMLTGKLPFQARDRDSFIEAHKHSKPMVAIEVNPKIDQTVSDTVAMLLEKDPNKRFRDAHHFVEKLKTLQRRVAPVSAPWIVAQQHGDPRRERENSGLISTIGLTAGISDIAAWALKATVFGRMVATSYPGGAGPAQVMKAIESIWRLAAASTRLDGELQAEAKRNERLLTRSKDFTAQVGRRIEDLSRAKSKLKREIAAASVDLERLRAEYSRADEELKSARAIITSIDKGRDEMSAHLRDAYEKAGAMAARRQARSEAVAKVEAKIVKWKEESARIDAQLEEYHQQMDRHSSAIDDDLDAGRRRLAAKVKERETYSRKLEESADYLSTHFNGKPECEDLFRELEELDRNSIVIEPSPSTVSF